MNTASRRTRLTPRTFAPALALALAFPVGAAGQLDVSRFADMHARNIGPGGMSGRVADVDVVLSNPNVIWVGSATGGLWKSVDGGLVFEPMTDDLPVSSIGQVTVNQSNPDIVWVGTGEANPRNSMGIGRGVWKSLDGGRSWQALGLENSQRISRILLDPRDPDVAWVAALGPAWSDGEERGVFRTTDGGQTWHKVLYANASTGAADMIQDPSNPDHLIAAMWDFRRWPWFFRSGGPGSGMFVTWDGGDTWKKLTSDDGLPSGELGRIGLAFARSNPSVVYALVEATHNALLRSDDGGASWRTVNRQPGVNPRPFYYADIRVDPANENRVYRVAGSLDVSEDGGKSFDTVVSSRIIHGDVHELWLSPDGRTLIQGNDGGVGISYDRGDTWRFVANLVLAQYYHINVDSMMPYNVLGGMQDNGSWIGPAYVWHSGGIRNYDFQRIGGGDGFDVVPDPTDSRYVYGMSQEGNLFRFDRVTGGSQFIQPVHPDPDVVLRFHWNAGIALDPHEPGTFYIGSQFVHRTRDGGRSWEIISPDLTTNDPEKQDRNTGGLTQDATGAENHTTILAIAPSPVQAGVIWVGTDDGNVQITRDGGNTWTNVADRIRGAPRGGFVPHIEASHFDAGTAYVVMHNYQQGDQGAYVFRTGDFGRSWDRIVDDGDIDGFARVIEEDPVTPNLLWVGGEFGLWVSVDAGEHWAQWKNGLPTVPIRDIVTHPTEHDLVLGSHGRGAFIIDDIRPVRAVATDRAVVNEAVRLFQPPIAYLHDVAEPLGYRSTGHAMWFGENRPFGARLSVWVAGSSPNSNSSSGSVEIIDARGTPVRTFTADLHPGVNRVVWGLQMDGVRGPDDDPSEPAPPGPEVPPGVYTARVTVDGVSSEAPLEVRLDPRVSDVDRADLVATAEAALDIARLRTRLQSITERIDRTRDAIDLVVERLDHADVPGADALREQAGAVKDRLDAFVVRISGDPDAQGIVDRTGTVRNTLFSAYTQPGPDAPTPNQLNSISHARAAVEALESDVNAYFDREVAALRQAVESAGLTLVPEA